MACEFRKWDELDYKIDQLIGLWCWSDWPNTIIPGPTTNTKVWVAVDRINCNLFPAFLYTFSKSIYVLHLCHRHFTITIILLCKIIKLDFDNMLWFFQTHNHIKCTITCVILHSKCYLIITIELFAISILLMRLIE